MKRGMKGERERGGKDGKSNSNRERPSKRTYPPPCHSRESQTPHLVPEHAALHAACILWSHMTRQGEQLPGALKALEPRESSAFLSPVRRSVGIKNTKLLSLLPGQTHYH